MFFTQLELLLPALAASTYSAEIMLLFVHSLVTVLLVSVAVHLPRVLSSCEAGVPAPHIHLTLNSSDLETAGHTIYNFGPGGISTSYHLLFSAECPNDTFSADESTGELIVAQTIEPPTEAQDPKCVMTHQGYELSIKTYSCFMVIEDLTHSYSILVVIDVIPSVEVKFPLEFYDGEVSEGVQGSPVHLHTNGIQVIGLSANYLSTINYRIINNSIFTVSTTRNNCEVSVDIQVAQPLDREVLDYYEIVLEAYSAGHSTNTTIGIHVLDKNDMAPVFLSPVESVTVSDRLAIGTVVEQFQGEDQDSGLNAVLLFSLKSESSAFTIDPLTGCLYRYSSEGLIQTTQNIEVWDSGSPQHTSSVNLTIFIASVPHHPPDIHLLGELTVSENDGIGHVITNIQISSPSSSNIHVTLDSTDCYCFKLSNVVMTAQGEYEAELVVNTVLDHESFPYGIIITITARDNEDFELSTSKEVIISIADVNEPPVFSSPHYEVCMFEGIPVGSEVFRLNTIDPDMGTNGELTYSITNSDSNSYLSLDPTLGILRTINTIDYESVTNILLTITAADGGGDIVSTTVTIQILDRNDHQPIFSNSETVLSIPESKLANESIFDFSAADNDFQCNGAVAYSIVHADPPVFRVDSFSGLLYPLTDDSLDYEEFQHAKLIVRARDLGEEAYWFSDIRLQINILDVNDERPQMDNIQCPCFMNELSTTELCQQLSAHDDDSTTLVFSIKSGNELDLFSISTTTGIVSTKMALHFEEKATHILQIVASDGELESEAETLKIIVVDVVNHSPTYSSSTINITSPIDTPIGFQVGDLSAQHMDIGFNSLTQYQFAGSIDGAIQYVFRLDALSGLLYLKSSPIENMYSFTVSATNIQNIGQASTVSVNVFFSGQRNIPPYFRTTVDYIDVASNTALGQIFQVSAMDDNDVGSSNGQLEYSFQNESTNFELDSVGHLSLVQSLEIRVNFELILFVVVSDGGSPSLNATQQLIVRVYASTETIGGQTFLHNPGLSVRHSIASIREASSQALSVFSLPETEGNSAVSYTILPQGEDYIAFSVVANEVMTKSNFETTFDRMQNEAVFLTLRAQYGSSFYHYSLTVMIEDINNNGPKFDQERYSVEIYRSTPNGAFIFEFSAVDPDIGNNAVTNYSIASNTDIFAIVPNTSFLEVIGELNDPSYMLSIVAEDSALGQSATTSIDIIVLQHTNNPPSIISTVYTVSENIEPGTVAGTLSVNDMDNGIHGKNMLCIASGNIQNHFQVNENRNIIVRQHLDYESKTSFTLSMLAYDSSPNPASSATQISITVLDENESPTFTSTLFFATVVENNLPGTPVLTVTAIDRDSGTAGEILFSVLNGTSSFEINRASGLISTTSMLNRESMSLNSFTIAVTDGGGMIATSIVQVSVLDENDETPSFISPNFASMKEDVATVGTQVLLLQARDLDKGANATVQFEIVSGNENGIFSLDPRTGSITLSKKLDYETDPEIYRIQFAVKDLGMPPLNGTAMQVTFVLENVNDNFPIFSSSLYMCSIQEGSNVFTSTCQINATDNDAVGNAITYEIVNGNMNNAFKINPQNGILIPQISLDREILSKYVLSVRAADADFPSLSSTALMLINILDMNDQVPLFDPVVVPESEKNGLSVFRIPELLPRNTLLFFAHAIDYDIGDNNRISYDILVDSNDLFRTDSNTSAVFLAGTFDYESAKSHKLTVRAANPSGTSTLQTYTIEILNVNENLFRPTFSPNISNVVTVPSVTTIGTQLLTVTATDGDHGPGGDIQYYIAGGTGYGYFEIDKLSGSIFVSYTLTAIEAAKVTIQVMAIDQGYPPLSSTISLLIVLEPDSRAKPFFIQPQFSAVAPETISSVGKVFSSIQALVNNYPISDITYCIVSGNNEEKFSINSSTGALSINTMINREESSIYTLVVNASRPESTSTSVALVAITVADENDFRPSFGASFSATIFSNHPTGSSNPFVRIFAHDLDAGENGVLTYVLNSGNTPFAIDSNTGDMYLTQNLPTNGNPSYEITITATDKASQPLSESATFTIMVTSPANTINNNAPYFSLASYIVEIPENTNAGTMLYSAQAISDNQLVYRFINPPINFAILPNSGDIYITRSLDREEETQYTLRIDATDGSLTSSAFLLNIVITDVNDNRPHFTAEEFMFTVTEHAENETTVGIVTAEDIDIGESGDSIMYSLVDSKHPSSIKLFTLTADGILRVNGVIDREEQPTHILTVAAEDGGNPSLVSYTRVEVTVTDINDHDPKVRSLPPGISISENTTVGTPFFNLSVFDPDTGIRGSFNYSLDPNNLPLAINHSTGQLYVVSQLDAENYTFYSLNITVHNQDNTTSVGIINLNVNITDELDSIPVLNNPVSVSIPENRAVYSFVALVADRVSSRMVHYSIISGNDGEHFFIESLTGIIRISTPLDRELSNLYTLTVQGAFAPGYEANVTFTVTVTDVNDEAPMFSSSFLEYTLPEDSSVLTPLLCFNITDSDEGSNSQIGSVFIPDTKAAQIFGVDSSGCLYLLQSLDREGKFDSITFEIYIFDSGDPPLYDQAQISIIVSDVNDNSPYFIASELSFIVSLPVLVDTILYQVEARDLDQSATIRYSIPGGNGSDKFNIDAISGGISIKNNYKLQYFYNLTVTACDRGGREASAFISITVKECGFAKLLFAPRDITTKYSEDTTIYTVIFEPNILSFGQTLLLKFYFSIDNPLFEIENDTGVVKLRRNLDREKQPVHYLSIQARDTNDPSRLAQADVEIIVTDVNDNAPMFQQSSYTVYIPDDHPVGSALLRVQAEDPDEGSNGIVTYGLLSAPFAFFSISEITGEISLISELDTLTLGTLITLLVETIDSGQPQNSATTNVTVNIVDSNAPVFTMNGAYSAEIEESTPRDTVVITVEAIAPSTESQITYTIASPDASNLPFSVSFFDGQVTVNDMGLDYETISSYRLELMSTDLMTSLEGGAVLDIKILDVNDNRPEFSMAFYEMPLQENSAIGSVVVKVNASDADTGRNADITYSIDQNNIATEYFNIESTNGQITTIKGVDREQNPSFEFSVFAVDGGSDIRFTAAATVRIEIIDINDNRPTFLESSYHGAVSEDDPSGTSILFLTATDLDGDNLEYGIVSSGSSSNFKINSGGLLTLNTSALELTVFEYILNVSVTDGVYYEYTQVVVEVEGQNHYPPEFNQTVYNAFVVEHTPTNTYVTQVFAFDADRGSNGQIFYTVSDSRFSVHKDTGVIRVSGDIDREASSDGIVRLVVVARDGGGRTGIAEVHIELEDINDNSPMFSTSTYIFDVSETVAIGTTVYTDVSATDPDDGSNGFVQYSTTSEGDNQFPFRIVPSSGAIITRTDLDFDAVNQYMFAVDAVDSGSTQMRANPPANITVSIINDGQEPLRFENTTYTVYVPENSFNTDILNLRLQNTTLNCLQVDFSIVQNLQTTFVISELDNTDLKANIHLQSCLDQNNILGSCLDHENRSSHSFPVEARCSAFDVASGIREISTFAFIVVNVLDVNDKPSFGTSFFFSYIMENIARFTILQLQVHQDRPALDAVSAHDEDSGLNGVLQYSIIGMVPFAIGQTSGIISVDGELDRELIDEYRFTVVAMDSGNSPQSTSALVLVIIEDVNDSPPVFEQSVYYVEVSEGAEINDRVFTVSVLDNDTAEFSQSSFSINDGEFFSISGNMGHIRTTRKLDRESIPVHSLQVFANDGINSNNATVIITVTDENDNRPIFNLTQYEVILPENYAVGVTILQVFATDADEGENADIEYSILDNQQLIYIDNITGEIHFVQTPDYEMSPQGRYEFQLRAANTGNRDLRDIAPLVIKLLDLNDNEPQFLEAEYTVQVAENRPAETTVTRVEALDADSGMNGTVVYTLNAEAEEYFDIESGIITTKREFDREANASFEVIVTASDLGDPPLSTNATVIILILDVNDNTPTFPEANYTMHVRELADIGTVIFNVRAEDKDIGSNADITYRLMGENSAHFNLVSRQDGSIVIQVAVSLNHEQVPLYELNLLAFDGGFPVMETTVSLMVNVRDENDNPPVFSPPLYLVRVAENVTVGHEITRVKATDQDSIDNAQLIYSIVDSDQYLQFQIDNDGSITVAQPLDYETDQFFTLLIQAEDQGFAATATVIVTITNVNDNAPEFTMINYTTSIKENSPEQELFDFTVVDRDIGATPEKVSFKIESGNDDDIFTLDPTSGMLLVEANFDFEKLGTDNFFLVITASDNDVPPLTGSAYVTVTVIDLNDNPPVGENQTIFVFLYNGQVALDTLGALLIRDPDTVNDHQFSVSGISDAFNIDSTGSINIKQSPPPPGINSFTVHVTDGMLGSVTTQVTITVVNITSAHIANSFIIQVDASSVELFLDIYFQPFLAMIEGIISEATAVFSSRIYIYSIQTFVSSVDLSIVVESGDGSYVHPNLIQHLIHVNRADIYAKLGLTVLTENVDLCTDDSVCSSGLSCLVSYQYKPSSVVLGSPAASLVGIDRTQSLTCSVPSAICNITCPEPSYCIIENGRSMCLDGCNYNPCKNGGECKEQNPGYYCSCTIGYEGRNCELKTASFNKGSYALFPALDSPSNGSIKLEFTTGDTDGLLYYSSRFDESQKDFLALEMADLHLSLLVSYGGNEMRLSTSSPLTGDNWYTAVVQYNSNVSNFQWICLCMGCTLSFYHLLHYRKFYLQ